MTKQIIIVIFTFTSCISSFLEDPVQSIPAELAFYYDSFIEDGKKHGFDYSSESIVIQIVDFEGGLSGLHVDRADNISQIQIDIDVYETNKQDTLILKWLIYHELGHAILNKNHKNDCESIMHPYFMMCSTQNFNERHDSMIKQLFLDR